jgi:hypothetical protein
VEARFAGDIGAFVRQHRNDPGGWGLGEARFVRHRDDPGAFFTGQRMRRHGPDSIGPPVAKDRAIVLSPPLDGAQVDPGQHACLNLPGAIGPRGIDLLDQGLAIFQPGRASSPSWKIAWSFFDSTSKAAGSASALSFRRSSRSSCWTPAARLEAVIATASLDETTRSAWCREHGVFPTALDAWKRDAVGGLGEPADDSVAAKQWSAASDPWGRSSSPPRSPDRCCKG